MNAPKIRPEDRRKWRPGRFIDDTGYANVPASIPGTQAAVATAAALDKAEFTSRLVGFLRRKST